MAWICINGEFVPDNEAKIPVWDHGYLYGDGLFETMRAYEGKVFALEDHLARLREGAKILRLSINYNDKEISSLLQETIKRNNMPEAYIRLTISRGDGPIGLDPALCPQTRLVIMAKMPQSTAGRQRGISLGVCPVKRNHIDALTPLIKSMNFLNNIFAKIWAKDNGFDEALMLNQEGFVTETTVSNIFFVKDQKVYTPALNSGILPGVTRKYVINIFAGTQHYSLSEGLFDLSLLQQADEIFLTNSGSEIIPVTKLNKKIVGNGVPGPITQDIHRLFCKAVKDYC